MTRNAQPAEGPSYDPQGVLDVHSIFYTIQGEGPFAGEPAVFVRTAGCTITCPGCDTDYTSVRRKWSVDELVSTVMGELGTKANLVVLTGGEPFRQNVTPFVRAVTADAVQVQVETNGTVWCPGLPRRRVTIVVSPKTSQVRRELYEYAQHWKYIIRHGEVDPADGLPVRSLEMNQRPARPPASGTVYVQPYDEADVAENQLNMEAAVKSCLQYGYKLSVQLHKLAGLP